VTALQKVGSPSRGATGTTGPPRPPSSVQDLALLLWPGTIDWRPELDLAADMREDLRWRLSPTTPRCDCVLGEGTHSMVV
jgi:hypothetical protein